MAAQIIDGEAIAGEIKQKIREEVESLKKDGKELHLRAILVGDDFGAKFYAGGQQKGCEEVGIKYTLDQLPADSTEADIEAHIKKLNDDPETTGIILLMPVPQGVNARRLQQMIAPNKDVEGMNPVNMGKIVYNDIRLAPCTPKGVVELIKRTGVKVEGAEVTVVGHSEIVGKPIAIMMLGLNATTSVVHIFTKDITPYAKNAEILIVAAGKSGAVWNRYVREKKKDPNIPLPDISPLIKADMIKPGAVVIDVAINRIPAGFDENGEPIKTKSGKTKMVTVGDVDFEAAKEIASHITPVPGGVGPMTVAMLLQNTVEAAKMSS